MFRFLSFDMSELTPNLEVIFSMVHKNYVEENEIKYCQILNPKKRIFSLRTIEHFLTDYSKTQENLQHVYEDYRRMVNSYSKKHFDCFARKQRVPVLVDGKIVKTTPGQLHFLSWFVEQKLDQEIEQKLDILLPQMKMKSETKKLEKAKKKKLREEKRKKKEEEEKEKDNV